MSGVVAARGPFDPRLGQRMLERWPQLVEVSFEAQNRTWELPRVSSADERVRVYTDPPAPYGRIGLVLTRERHSF